MPRLRALALKHTDPSTPPDVSPPIKRPKLRTRPYTIKRLSLMRKLPRRKTPTLPTAKMTVRDLVKASHSKLPNDISKEAHFERPNMCDMTKDSIHHEIAEMFVTSMQKFNRLLFWPPYDHNTYLELESSSLTNKEFHTIQVFDNMDSWMADNILNVALELLSKRLLCSANNIEIANSMISSIIWRAGEHGDVDENNFACYKEERKRFRDKKWIFLPINDGFSSTLNNGSGGTHWSLLAVDRLKGTAHYIDSLYIYDYNHQEIAKTTMKGLMYILEESLCFCIEEHSPNQQTNNLNGKWDWGPCAPFVYCMIQRYVENVRILQDMGREGTMHLHLSAQYPGEFGMWFDSLRVRADMAQEIAFAAHLIRLDRPAREHNEAAMIGIKHASVVETASQHGREPGNEEQIQERDRTHVQGHVEETEQGPPSRTDADPCAANVSGSDIDISQLGLGSNDQQTVEDLDSASHGAATVERVEDTGDNVVADSNDYDYDGEMDTTDVPIDEQDGKGTHGEGLPAMQIGPTGEH